MTTCFQSEPRARGRGLRRRGARHEGRLGSPKRGECVRKCVRVELLALARALANASTTMLQRQVGVRGPFGPFQGRSPRHQGAGRGVKMGLGLGSLGAGSWQLDVEVGR